MLLRRKDNTAEEAKVLGKLLGAQVLRAGAFLLATNGPRTGQNDSRTGQKLLTHRTKDPETGALLSYKMDEVSQAFLEGLKEAGLQEGKHFVFSDFQFGIPSDFKPFLGAALSKEGSQVFLPGESTSMISEGYDNLPADTVTLVTNHDMNETHRKHVNAMSGYAARLDYTDGAMKRSDSKATHSSGKLPSAAATIATNVNQRFNVVSADRAFSREAMWLPQRDPLETPWITN